MSIDQTIEQIDALLPQTQCGLCEYDGCRPYATAIAHNEASIDRCAPGGVATLKALAQALAIDPEPYVDVVQQRYRPPMIAQIQEDACIGCTKCISACPTDAIIGSAKRMHTVITEACTGCELCIPPCPVDCIDLIPVTPATAEQKITQAATWKDRYLQKQNRQLTIEQRQAQQHHQAKKQGLSAIEARKAAIEAAVTRVQKKKNHDSTDD